MNTKTIKRLTAVVGAVSMLSQLTMARDFADIYCDCGLGAMIAPRNDAVAAVTNVTWDLGTTAISSNISSPSTCMGGKERVGAFIHNSYESLVKDLARGNGSYLDTLVVMSGCIAEKHPVFTSALRDDFARVVAKPGYSDQNRFEKAKNFYNVFYNLVDGDFADVCTDDQS